MRKIVFIKFEQSITAPQSVSRRMWYAVIDPACGGIYFLQAIHPRGKPRGILGKK